MNVFGHGIKTYFETMYTLMWVFLCLCILYIPVFGIYNAGGQLEGLTNYSDYNLMLGNLGMRKPLCFHQFLNLNQASTLKCSVGFLSAIEYVGVLPINRHTFRSDYCGDPLKDKFVSDCTDNYLYTDKLT